MAELPESSSIPPSSMFVKSGDSGQVLMRLRLRCVALVARLSRAANQARRKVYGARDSTVSAY